MLDRMRCKGGESGTSVVAVIVYFFSCMVRLIITLW